MSGHSGKEKKQFRSRVTGLKEIAVFWEVWEYLSGKVTFGQRPEWKEGCGVGRGIRGPGTRDGGMAGVEWVGGGNCERQQGPGRALQDMTRTQSFSERRGKGPEIVSPVVPRANIKETPIGRRLQ